MDTVGRENYLDRKSGFGGDTGEFAHSAENRELSGIWAIASRKVV